MYADATRYSVSYGGCEGPLERPVAGRQHRCATGYASSRQCTTSAVNGQTYACAMIKSPISAASARLWKNT